VLRIRFGIAFVIRLAQLSIIVVPFVVFVQGDPFYYVLRHIPPNSLSFDVIKYIIRVLLSVIGFSTFCRTLSLALIFIFGICVCGIEALTIQLNASKRIRYSFCLHRRTSSCWLRIMQSISDYVMFKIFLYSSAYKFTCNAASLGISLLTAVVICSGFATIRMPLVIPMPFYIMFPAVLVIYVIGVSVWFPYAINANDMFTEIKANWIRTLDVFPKLRRTYLVRHVKGIKVEGVAIMLGDYKFSGFNRSSITGCFKRSIEYLITACLSIQI
jgi:hypothetical protein